MKTDPVCGMDVKEDTQYDTLHGGRKMYFCSQCRRSSSKTLGSTLPAKASRKVPRKAARKLLKSSAYCPCNKS